MPNPPPSSSEARRLRPARRPTEFERIVEEHRKAVEKYCVAHCDSAADADDAAAETFCVAWRNATWLLAADTPCAWLFAVAGRVVSNQRRSNARQNRLIERLVRQTAPAVECGTGDPRLDGLAEALACLSTTDKELIVLSTFVDLSHAEIAAALSLPLPRVRDRLYESRRRLRSQLDSRLQD